ncbi:branched-chain amino acid ABC transporter permease [Natronomonas sp. EA1]|uniref:branched-chain amino acid ABC transporter permease n=1 Tax=Natronomonas sp. EA1 TaxID=3421655 RepID=UPI003EB6A3AE
MVSSGLIFDQIITGISIGSRLFLVAVGLSLIFGVLEVLNFTHGVMYMIGAYMSVAFVEGLTLFGVINIPALGFVPGILAAIIVVGVLGIFIEGVFIRRMYGREELDQLLLTFAFVLILTDLTRFTFGSQSRVINAPAVLEGTIRFTPSLAIPTYRAFVILMSIVVMGALFLVLRQTNIGRVTRATSSDREMASLLGINVPLLYTGVFFVGAALAGFGGALAAPLQSVTPSLGDQVIISAFVVVVIGGLGSFAGAFVGAMLIGLLTALGSLVVSGAGQLFPFIAMILVLVWKPTGLFGGAEA